MFPQSYYIDLHPDLLEALLGTGEGTSKGKSAASPSTSLVFTVGDVRFTAMPETVMCGHDDTVYSLRWRRDIHSLPSSSPPPLLSASMDRRAIIWEKARNTLHSAESNAAVCNSQEGEGGDWTDVITLGGMGGNVLGFFGAVWGPSMAGPEGGDLFSVIAHNYTGAIQIWQECFGRGDGEVEDSDVDRRVEENQRCRAMVSREWRGCLSPSGHFGAVRDVCFLSGWEAQQQERDTLPPMICSVSADETTRVWSIWRNTNCETGTVQWTEVEC